MRDSGDVPARLPGGGPVQEWIAVLAALISAVGAFVSVWYGRRAARVERMNAAEELATLLRESLLQAVFNLETRIYNIIELDFFGHFLGKNNAKEDREYAELNTMYLLLSTSAGWKYYTVTPGSSTRQALPLRSRLKRSVTLSPTASVLMSPRFGCSGESSARSVR
jgi:hypothetical protein